MVGSVMSLLVLEKKIGEGLLESDHENSFRLSEIKGGTVPQMMLALLTSRINVLTPRDHDITPGIWTGGHRPPLTKNI
jgi:hypothetical protein